MSSAISTETLRSAALMFPGQGSQYPGMGADLAAESSKARQIFERANDILGYSLTRIMFDDRGDELNRTVHTQPAVFVHSMALLGILEERYALCPVVAGGHSLGEYSALCAAGILDFADAVDIIRIRARGMDQAQPAGTCGMAAIIGLTKDRVLELIEGTRGADVLEAANFNSPDQVVVSGVMTALTRVVEAAGKLRRTKAVLLPVSSAFHTALMEPAKDALNSRLEGVSFGEARFPVIANLNARPYPASPQEIRRNLVDQVVRPVLWEDCVTSMKESGPTKFVEIGPGKVLTGLLRRIDKQLPSANISDVPSVGSLEAQSA
ncbi:MAG: ACP S-malonyltransferase [Desulfomonilaceae bacterium]|nr:ACP S-malonyltransferase [Desulfomonilaceae bacterium]